MELTETKFGVWTLTFLVVANMVGVGVFTTSGFTIGELGSPLSVVFAWLIGGILAIAGALSYGQLVRKIPESGGEYVFLSRAAHPLLGFIAGWVSLIAGFTGAIAIAATGFESYAFPDSIPVPFYDQQEDGRPYYLPRGSIAIAVIVFAGLCHGVYVSVGATIQNLAVLLKLGFLVFFIGFAVSTLGSSGWVGFEHEPSNLDTRQFVPAFAGSIVWISFSYLGFNAAVYLAEEAKDPKNTVPKALLLGTVVVTLLYILLNAIFVYAPPKAAIADKVDVAAIAARWLGGSRVEIFVRCVISGALLTSVTSMMMAAPRVYAKMADDGFFPSFMKATGQTSKVAIIVQVGLASVIVLVATLRQQLNYLSLTLSLSAVISVCCLFLPNIREQRRIGMRDVPPLVFVIGTSIACCILIWRDMRQAYATVLTFAVGSIVYFATRRS